MPRTKKRQSAGVSHRSGGLEAARPRHIGRSAPAVCQPHARSHGSSARTPAWPRGAGSSVQLQRVKGGEDGEEVVGSSRRRRSQCSSSWVMVWSGSTSVVVDPRMTEGRSWRPSCCSSPGGAVCARLCWVHLLIKDEWVMTVSLDLWGGEEVLEMTGQCACSRADRRISGNLMTG